MRKEPRDNPEVQLDPELESDLGPELEMRGDQLMADLEEARAEAARNLETAQRAQAEFDNFRKRMARDHADAVKRAGERIVGHCCPWSTTSSAPSTT
jgi:molecular chaperone GrpE (heat shock protein)